MAPGLGKDIIWGLGSDISARFQRHVLILSWAQRGVGISPPGFLPAAVLGLGVWAGLSPSSGAWQHTPPHTHSFSQLLIHSPLFLSSPPPSLRLSCLMNEGWGFKPFLPPRPAALAWLLSLG